MAENMQARRAWRDTEQALIEKKNYSDQLKGYGERVLNNGNHRNGGYSDKSFAQNGVRRPAGSRQQGGSSLRSGNAGISERPANRSQTGSRTYRGNQPSSSTTRRTTGNVGSRPSAGSRSRNYTRATNQKTVSSSPRGPYRQVKKDDEELPISVYIGIAVTVIAVVVLIVSVSMDTQRKKDRKSAYDYEVEVSNTDVSDEYIDVVSEEEQDEPVSSQVEYKNFLGIWYKSDVPYAERVIFSVSMQYSDSFEFRLEFWNGNESKVINNTAFYTDETHAEYSPKSKTKIVFERGEDSVIISHSGKNSAFGIPAKFVIDGTFTEEEPEASVEETVGSYDYYLYKSDSISNALKSTLSAEDYALYQDLMTNGLKPPVEDEKTTDRNGNAVNVDAELNAVKYYAQSDSQVYEMILICSENSNIYLMFYNSDEIIYYTNDANYSNKLPSSFQAIADSSGVKPTFR